MEHFDGKKRRALIIAAIVVAASTVSVVWIVDRSERGVVLTVDTDREQYAPGDPVLISAQLKNYGFRTANLLYSSSLIVQFSVYDSDGLLAFVGPLNSASVMTTVVLEPGGTWNSEYVWHQVDSTGEQVELPDSFTVIAVSHCFESSFSANTAISISN